MYTLFDEITLCFVTWWEIGHVVHLTFGQFSQDFQDVELFMYNYNHFLRKSLRLGPERQEAENEWSRVWVGSGHLYSNHGFGVVAGVCREERVFKCSLFEQQARS